MTEAEIREEIYETQQRLKDLEYHFEKTRRARPHSSRIEEFRAREAKLSNDITECIEDLIDLNKLLAEAREFGGSI